MTSPPRIGTAGWTIPKPHAAAFPSQGTHLQRYAQCLPAVEINSSFYRPHKPQTYARWAASVPPGFRFAVKLPREITHKRKLADAAHLLQDFLTQTDPLGETRGPLLVQLPPSLAFDEPTATAFLATFRTLFAGDIALEPRHPTWFTDPVDQLLAHHHVARVAADPPPVPRAAIPGGWPNLVYRRLHGAPRTYYSPYAPDDLDALARNLRAPGNQWCIFDNTALGWATHDAQALLRRLTSAATKNDDARSASASDPHPTCK